LFSSDATLQLKTSKAELKTYTREILNILRTITVTVSHKYQKADLHLLVVAEDGPNLLDHDWLSHIKLDWTRLNHVQSTPACQQILDKHDAVFKEQYRALQLMPILIMMFG